MYRVHHFSCQVILCIGLVLSITACSTLHAPNNQPHTTIGTVVIDTRTSQADLEAIYGAKSILFKPELGFAILGFYQTNNTLDSVIIENNQNALETPEVTSEGFNAWASGWSAWASGWDAWAGGNATEGYSLTTLQDNEQIWSTVRLDDAHQRATHLGQGIKIAVIDTGLDINHPSFTGRLAPEEEWKDYVDDDDNPQEAKGDYYGHGTAVAGIILQVAPKAHILPIRVLDGDGKGDLDDVISAVDWAISQGATIINLSLGTQTNSTALKASLLYAANQGIFITTSAGNTGDSEVTYPARWSQEINQYEHALEDMILSVGSSSLLLDDTVTTSPFSSYGTNFVDVIAPAETVWAPYPEKRKARFSGTSFAAPMGAGALALALAEPVSKLKDPKLIQHANWYLENSANVLVFDTNSEGRVRDGLLDIGQYLQNIFP